MQKSVEDVFSKIKRIQVPSGKSVLKSDNKPTQEPKVVGDGFLKDLSRMEKELSF